MRARFLLPAAFLFLAPPLFAQVEVQYNKESDVTTVSVPLIGIVDMKTLERQTRRRRAQARRPGPIAVSRYGSGSFGLRAGFQCAGDQLCVPRTVQMVFVTYNRQPKYRTNHQVTLVLDKDAEIIPARTRYWEQTRERSKYPGGYENFFCDMETSVFLRIAEAGRVDYRIGPTKDRLSKDQQAALAALAEKIEDAKESGG